MSETILAYLAGTLWRGALLSGLLLLLEACCRRKLLFARARWFYWGWLLLVLLPGWFWPRLEIPLPAAAPSPVFFSGNDVAEPAGSDFPEALPPETAAGAPEALPRPGWADWGLLVYSGIVLVLSAKQIRQFIGWRRRVLACPAITQGRVFDVFQETTVLTGQSETPVALRDAGALLPSPASFGYGRDRTVLCRPADMTRHTDAELRMLLIHELGHLKYFDNPAACLSGAVARVWWFNPFVAWILKRAAFAGELNCDRLVRDTLRLAGNQRSVYARLLLLYQQRSAPHSRPAFSPLGGSAENLKLRILEFAMKNNRIQLAVLSGLAAAAFAGALLFTPVLRAADNPVPPAVEVPDGNPLLAALNRAIRNTQKRSYHAFLEKEVLGDGMARTEHFYQLVDPEDGFVYKRRDFGRRKPGGAEIIDQTNLVTRSGNYIYSATNAIKRPGATTSWPPAPVAGPGITVRAEYPAPYRGIPCVVYTVTHAEIPGTQVYWVGRDNDFVYSRTDFGADGKILPGSQALGEVDFQARLTPELFQVPDGIPVTEVKNTDEVAPILFPGDFPEKQK